MSWVFAGVTFAAVLMATFESHMRRAILALWVAGLGVGALYLTVGAEFLAIIQWIVSTLVAISFTFFAVMFGEYQQGSESKRKVKFKPSLLTLMAIVIGAGFALVIGLGSSEVNISSLMNVVQESDLTSLGRKLTQDHLLSLEVLALTLFLVLVGGGAVARTEGDDS